MTHACTHTHTYTHTGCDQFAFEHYFLCRSGWLFSSTVCHDLSAIMLHTRLYIYIYKYIYIYTHTHKQVVINLLSSTTFDAFSAIMIFMQQTGIITRFKLRWHPNLDYVSISMAIVNFDVDFFGPQCLLTQWVCKYIHTHIHTYIHTHTYIFMHTYLDVLTFLTCTYM